MVALYLAIKRKESGKLQFVPSGKRGFGVVKVALVDGNIVGLDSTWGATFKSLHHMFEWDKAIVQRSPIDPSDHLPKLYIPRQEALSLLVGMEVANVKGRLRDISPDEARDLMAIRIGKSVPVSPEEMRRIKEGKFGDRSFFLQKGRSYASVFIAGEEFYTFRLIGDRVERISIGQFPDEGERMVKVDHLVALAVSVPFFAPGREVEGRDLPVEVERLKRNPNAIWHILLSSLGGIYVSVLGYRGLFIGAFILYGDELKMKGENSLKAIAETINLKGRLYEYGTDMRSA